MHRQHFLRSPGRSPVFAMGTLLLSSISLHTPFVSADNVTASTDYGFGPLWVSYNVEGDILSRCSEVSFDIGGGFGPYVLAAVNAANKSTRIQLKTNTSAIWEIILSEDSHVAFNLTDRAGASVQTDFLNVQKSEDSTCGNDTAYKAAPVKPTSGSASAIAGVDLIKILMTAGLACALAVLVTDWP